MDTNTTLSPDEKEQIRNRFCNIIHSLLDGYSVTRNRHGSIILTHKDNWGINGRAHPFHKGYITVDSLSRKNNTGYNDVDNNTNTWNEDLTTIERQENGWNLGIFTKQWKNASPYKQFKNLVYEAASLPVSYDPEKKSIISQYDTNTREEYASCDLYTLFVYAKMGEKINKRNKRNSSMLPRKLHGINVTGGPIICDAIFHCHENTTSNSEAFEWIEILFTHIDYEPEHYMLFGERPAHNFYNVSYESETSEDHIVEIPVENTRTQMDTDAKLFSKFQENITLPNEDNMLHTPEITLPKRPRVTPKNGPINNNTLPHTVHTEDKDLFNLLARRGTPTVECVLVENTTRDYSEHFDMGVTYNS